LSLRPEALALAQHRLARAHDTLAERDRLLESGAAPGAVNRYYYAAYAARALLATLEADSAKHSGVIVLFQKHFVASGIFPAEDARALPRAFERRLRSDYDDFSSTSTTDARTIRSQVEAFVARCAEVLAKLAAGS
jgi:uncharacterized protein (UPF0332 family)